MAVLCRYDDCEFERHEDGTWICKSWAMKGPLHSMMDKQVPEPYASKIEGFYQKSIKNEERYQKLVILGDSNLKQKEISAQQKELEVKADIKVKVSKQKVKKDDQFVVKINPFE